MNAAFSQPCSVLIHYIFWCFHYLCAKAGPFFGATETIKILHLMPELIE